MVEDINILGRNYRRYARERIELCKGFSNDILILAINWNVCFWNVYFTDMFFFTRMAIKLASHGKNVIGMLGILGLMLFLAKERWKLDGFVSRPCTRSLMTRSTLIQCFVCYSAYRWRHLCYWRPCGITHVHLLFVVGMKDTISLFFSGHFELFEPLLGWETVFVTMSFACNLCFFFVFFFQEELKLTLIYKETRFSIEVCSSRCSRLL